MHVHTFFQRLSDINHVERQRLLMKELLGHNASSTMATSSRYGSWSYYRWSAKILRWLHCSVQSGSHHCVILPTTMVPNYSYCFWPPWKICTFAPTHWAECFVGQDTWTPISIRSFRQTPEGRPPRLEYAHTAWQKLVQPTFSWRKSSLQYHWHKSRDHLLTYRMAGKMWYVAGHVHKREEIAAWAPPYQPPKGRTGQRPAARPHAQSLEAHGSIRTARTCWHTNWNDVRIVPIDPLK